MYRILEILFLLRDLILLLFRSAVCWLLIDIKDDTSLSKYKIVEISVSLN